MSNRRSTLIKISLAALILIIVLAVFLIGREKEEDSKTQAYSKLTGVEVEPEIAERPILGVIVENTEAARPQTGLDAAGIVFETVTEGGITRYLALYQEDMPDVVGPVRSLRPYFVDWTMGFDASVAHVGGSAEALQLVEQRDAKSLNQFKYKDSYYRDRDRPAPHNVYARTQELRDLQKELGHDESQFEEIPRSSDTAAQNPQATNITVDYSSPLYRAEFRYQPNSNTYIRYLTGEPHIDAVTNQPISVKNVIVIKTSSTESITAVGSGEALVFKDGNVINAKWRKASYNNRIEVIDSQNNQIPLNRGDTWFAVLPPGRPVTY